MSSFSESFIPSDKQGGAVVLREECDIVNRRNLPSCFSECKQPRRSSCSAFPSSMAGAFAYLSLQIILGKTVELHLTLLMSTRHTVPQKERKKI
jgi:hypothetical protein